MFARTERLTLRPAWPEDTPLLATAGHEPLARLLGHGSMAADDASVLIPVSRGPHEPQFVIETHEADRPALVGAIGLYGDARGADLVFWLTPAARGRGYATEAGRAVIDMARHALPLTQVRARHCATDAASARVLEKLGFSAVGRESRLRSSTPRGRVDLLYDLDVAPGISPLSLAA